MAAFIIRRLILLMFVLVGVSLLVFGILMTFSPERRAAAYITTPQQAKDIPRIIRQFGLDDPVYVQYGRWIRSVAAGHRGVVPAHLPVCFSSPDDPVRLF